MPPFEDGSTTAFTRVVPVSEEQLPMFFDILEWMRDSTTPVMNAGNFTVGCAFQPTKSTTIIGIKFFWSGAVARTVKCALRNTTGALLASVNVVTSGAGYYTGTFGTPQVINPVGEGQNTFKASVYDTSATEYPRWATAPSRNPTFPFIGGANIVFVNLNAFAAGDANPTGSGAEFYPVEPVLAA